VNGEIWGVRLMSGTKYDLFCLGEIFADQVVIKCVFRFEQSKLAENLRRCDSSIIEAVHDDKLQLVSMADRLRCSYLNPLGTVRDLQLASADQVTPAAAAMLKRGRSCSEILLSQCRIRSRRNIIS
jgi:hypothetical protein